MARANDQFRHHDFRTLLQHQQLFYRGFYPHAAVEAPPPNERFVNSVYPPYAFVNAVLWLPPGFNRRLVEGWFTGCQLAAIAVLFGFVWRRGREIDPRLGWLLVSALAAMTGLWADFLFGNFSALACAPLVALFAWEKRTHSGLAGVAWWAAMLKPQVGVFFFTLLLREGRGRAAAVGTALIVLGMVLACGWTGVAPWDALSAVYLRGLWALSGDGHSLITVAVLTGIPGSIAQPLLALLGLAGLVVVLRTRLHEADTLTRFALVAVVARLCLYHRPCDDLLLVFTMAAVARRAWQTRLAADSLIALGLGVTVWLPTRWTEYPMAKTAIVAVWVIVAIQLIRQKRLPRVSGQPDA